ncbi:MAG TPA: DNA polymerase III subunit gamma/tau [Candidatus Baltobacteraceae bacterium]|nr:DNA polymerase III subunit gamma/tau [Candidatus Baltobacteraceae bacterium]
MSLYRTWRPKTFSGLVGQDAVVRTLSSALETGKLAHAYLFSGPRGSGKTSAAKILARCIDCVNGPTPEPDNTCENCLAILNGTALDVLEIDAASNRGIDEIRALRDAVKFAPSVMRKKVYIIDEAHMLTKEGANAFLKTLEEPPDHAVFILATTEPEKLPVTILSRCQRYAFRRIAIPVMIARMREIADAEGIPIDDAALSAIAYRADGGLRDALTMLEQAAAFAEGAITTATIDLAFGSTGRNYAGALLQQIIDRDAAAVLKTIDDASDAGADMQVLVRSLIAEFRHLLVARIDPELLGRDLAAQDAQAAAARAKQITQAQIIRALRLLTEALATARSSGHPRLELESAMLRYVLAAEDPTLDAINARLSALEEGAPAPAPAPKISAAPPPAPEPEPVEAAAPAPPPPAAASAPAAAPAPAPKPVRSNEPLTIQKVRAAWQSIRTNIESEKQSLRVQLARAVPDAIDGNALVIKLPSSFMAETLRDHTKLVEKAISDVLGTELKATFKVEGTPRAAKGAQAEPAAAASNDDPDELFTYLNERIK